jgi:mono/diheme cytochrome c family protein/glucose/arabinose dehydrogenase
MIRAKQTLREDHMRIRTLALAGVALAVSAAIAFSATKPAPAPKGTVMSVLNRPWPAPVVRKQPKFPPALSPEQEARTFHMAPGYQLELVAAEPLVVDPVFAEFDGNGRLWVVEMQGYAVGKAMVNMTEPVGDIAILEDTDGDGIFDKRTVFQDKLVLPRALKILDKGCALIGEPPNLVKACDTNGDLVADTKEILKDGFGRLGNIEHAANGLFWGMDNTINVSEHTYNVLPKDGGAFETVPNLNRGQWGITQNDAGLIFRDVNTDPLFVDYIPARYFTRNPDVTRTRGLYENLVDQEKSAVWPVHPTLGVNRGYRPEVPRPDGSAYYYQGVSSPLFYRGDTLPLYGNALVVDSPTNLVHLLKVNTAADGTITAGDYWPRGEFLASTDERFRPVMMTPHWDGSVLIVDMYRGVSQDEPIQTDYLKNYILQHRLWDGIHKGRIWRVVYKGMKPARAMPAMIGETPAQLVAHLSDANGWWRDTAQQLLVQRNDKSVVPALKALAMTAPDARTRTQSLWTLSGMQALDAETVNHALDDASADVRLAGVRGAEGFLAKGQMLEAVLKLASDANAVVRHQAAASLGELPPAARLAPVVGLLHRYGDDAILVDAGVSGLKGQEADALALLVAQPGANADPVEMLAGAAGKSRNVAQVDKVIGFATDSKQPAPLRLAMLGGVNTGLIGIDARRFGSNVAGGKAGGGIADAFARARPQVKPLALESEPVALTALAAGTGDLAAAAKTVVDNLTWPGKPVPPAPKNTRTPEEDKLFAVGRIAYETNCTGCHQARGEGAPRIAPALAGSQIVTGRADMSLRVLLNGKDGKIGEMPPLGQSLSDSQLAGVLTYIRGSFGNTATPIHPALAKEFRQLYAFRKKPWTDAELQKQPR